MYAPTQLLSIAATSNINTIGRLITFARMAFVIAAFNLLVQWHGFQPDASGMVHLSIAEFSL